MHSDDFEKAFGDFLESEVYDRGEDALFTLTRAAFIAGWKAAGANRLIRTDCFKFSLAGKGPDSRKPVLQRRFLIVLPQS